MARKPPPGGADDDEIERFRRIDAVFGAALDLSPGERASFIERACEGDGDLKNAVLRLIRAHDRSHDFLEGRGEDPLFHSLTTPMAEATVEASDEARAPDEELRDRLQQALGASYRIESRIARGGMAVVYLAHDVRHDRPVAVKVLDPSLGAAIDADAGAKRFLHEIRLTARLQHPNLLPLFDSGASEGLLYYVMPFVPGETLRDRLGREAPLAIDEAVRIALAIAAAIGHAHERGIVHRDLKPANVLLQADHPIVADFGVAVALSSAGGERATRTGVQLGTPQYMAPEQVMGHGKADEGADVYALGAMLYEMLTGEPPHVASSARAVLVKRLAERPTPVRVLRSGVPPPLADAVERALEFEPADRFRSAGDFAAALSAATREGRAGHPELAGSGQGFPRWRWLASTGLAALGVLVVTTWPWPEPFGGGGDAELRLLTVLPFRAADGRTADDDLLLGLTDAVITQLSRLAGVAVTSAPAGDRAVDHDLAGFTGEPDQEREFETAVVRGFVGVAPDSVRLALRLLDTRSGREIERRHTIGRGELPALQRMAATEIIDGLGLAVGPSERASIQRVATVSTAAYEFYLRGRAMQLRDAPGQFGQAAAGSPSRSAAQPSLESLRAAQSLYALARELDPDFAMARARLAMAQLQDIIHFGGPAVRHEQARLEAEHALRLEPELPEAHHALAVYWMAQGDPRQSTQALRSALASAPNRADLHLALGLNLRMLGRWDEAIEELERAISLDPRNTVARTEAAVTYSRLRQYDAAIGHWDRVIALSGPGDHLGEVIRGNAFLRKGLIDSMSAAVSRVPPDWDDGGAATWARYKLFRIQGRHEEALAMLDGASLTLVRDGITYRPVSLLRAGILEDMGDSAGARANYEAARAMLADSVSAHPEDARIRVGLGVALAGLGHSTEAVAEARLAMDLVPLAVANPLATAIMAVAAEIFVQVGDSDAALDLLEVLLAMPAGREVSVPLLRVDPAFAPLAGDERFERLLARFSGT
jgi:tetratricopeptide (TPR) repeat protein/TolB-like protein